MIGKIGELAIVILVFCFALKMAMSMIEPIVPELILGSIIVALGVTWYQRKRNW